MTEITGVGYDGRPRYLVDAHGKRVHMNSAHTTFRGEACKVVGGSPPHKPGSTGRVWLEFKRHKQEVFPSVVNLQWERPLRSSQPEAELQHRQAEAKRLK